MGYYVKTVCPRCGRPLSGRPFDPCPDCRKELNVSYETVFDVKNAAFPAPAPEKGIYRFADFFALAETAPKITLGEGNTPLRKLERLGAHFGLDHLYMKDESKNPSLSHKDRLCSLLVSKALEAGAPGIVLSSTGNQGAAAAAYCKVAGLPCVVFTTPNVSPVMKTLMQAFGAYVFVTPTMNDRLLIMRELVDKLGFFPASGIHTPPIGSLCYAVDAYKTIAFETYEQMGGQLPDWFVVPVSYGDTLYGIHKGMTDLVAMGLAEKTSRMAAAEVFGAAQKSLESNSDIPLTVPTRPSFQTSIAVGSTTYLTVRAIRESRGAAALSRDSEVLPIQKLLAEKEGVFAEPSSAASIVALQKLVDAGKIKKEDKIVLLITSTGIKDPETASKWLPNIPCIQPDLTQFLFSMENDYHHKL